MNSIKQNMVVALLGSPEFSRRIKPLLQSKASLFSGTIADGWSTMITHRPDCVIVEIGIHHNARIHSALRKLLFQLRERFGPQIYVVAALLAPEKLFFGGDLLFLNEESLTPSGLIDTFIALPPANLPSVASIQQQLENLIGLLEFEFERRLDGKPELPALGTPGWVQSLADPGSRNLWMRWLPRYASYTNENPIIIGATGTGKTNLAYALHQLSCRPGQFVSITPRDFSSSELVQAELFGAVAGAYTGAVEKWGLVKRAEKGTLFIDELQSIDKELQGKLITFIENKVYRRVGSAETVEADVRFVFASNRTLYQMMESNVLRDDFAYRLERVQLDLLALSERPLDVTAGLAHALAKIYRQRPHSHAIEGLTADAYRLLFCHRWPGNLRQLENNAAQLCERTDMKQQRLIDAIVVSEVFESRLTGAAFSAPEVIADAALALSGRALRESISTLDSGLNAFIETLRLAALEAKGGDIKAASHLIGDDPQLIKLFVQGHLIKQFREYKR